MLLNQQSKRVAVTRPRPLNLAAGFHFHPAFRLRLLVTVRRASQDKLSPSTRARRAIVSRDAFAYFHIALEAYVPVRQRVLYMRSWKQYPRRSLFFLEIWKNEHGQDLIEYAMIAAFIALVSGMFMPNFAQDVSTMYSKLSSAVKGAS